jgi:glycosyltransferase involved in cell wall biosynthesis
LSTLKLSLVIPCFNEAKNLPLLLKRCDGLLAHEGVEVILVDNGSTDDSPKVLAELLPQHPGCRSIRVEKNQGYGHGIVYGLKVAKGEVLAWTHADMQTDPQDAWRGLAFFEGSADAQVFVKGERTGRPFADVVFTVGMSVFETFLMRRAMRDINAQPTMFSRRFFESWTSPPNDFSLDLFAYYLALESGLKVRRFPVVFGERAHGVSHWNVNWQAKWKFIKRTVSYSLELKRKHLK